MLKQKTKHEIVDPVQKQDLGRSIQAEGPPLTEELSASCSDCPWKAVLDLSQPALPPQQVHRGGALFRPHPLLPSKASAPGQKLGCFLGTERPSLSCQQAAFVSVGEDSQ